MLSGLALAILFSLVICELLQGFTALAFGATNLSFNVSGIKLYAGFALNSGIIMSSIIFIIPYLFTIAAIELSIQLLKIQSQGFLRYSLITFSLVLSGFLLVDLFYSAFSVILRFNLENDWVQLTNLLYLSEGERIALLFFVIIFTAGYLNLSAKRIIKHINI